MELIRDKAIPNVRTSLPGPYAKKWEAFHMKHAALSTYEKGFVWDRKAPAIGPFCMDPDGNLFLDFASHVASNALGYNHPKLLEVAKKVSAIDPDRYAGADFIAAYGKDPAQMEIPTVSHLHKKMIQLTKQFNFTKAFFSNSGAEAVENAIKLAYAARKNNGYGFCFYGAFHGRTLGALSLNRSKVQQKKWYPEVPKIVSLRYCSCKEHCECGWMVKARNGESISQLVELFDSSFGTIDPEELSYIIIEPIQGEGGYKIPNKKFMKEVRKISQQYHIPLIDDEIQTGIGRTGKIWAIEHFDIKPDMITASKALRVGATIGREEFFPKEEGRISGTWCEGNALATALGYTLLEVIEKERLLKNATEKGNYFLKRLNELKQKFSCVQDVRGLGLMDAIELDTKERRDKLVMAVRKKGLLILGCGYKAARFLPPLDVHQREIDLAMDILEASLKEVC